MPRLIAVAAASIVLAASPAITPAAAPARKVKVAVMEIRAFGADAHMANLLSEVALTEVGAMDRVDAIGKSDIESMLGFESQKKMLGCTEEASCVAEIGGALGVEYVVVGSLGRIGALFRLDMKVVETAKGRVRARTGESVEGREEKLVSAIQRSVHRLLDPIVQPSVGLEPPRPTVVPEAAVQPEREPEPKRPAAPGASRRFWGYTVGATGLAAVVGGAVSGLSAKSAYDKEKTAAAAGDIPGFESYRDQAKSRALIADVLYGVGAAGVGVGVYLVLTAPSGSAPPVAVHFAPTPSGALLVLSGGF